MRGTHTTLLQDERDNPATHQLLSLLLVLHPGRTLVRYLSLSILRTLVICLPLQLDYIVVVDSYANSRRLIVSGAAPRGKTPVGGTKVTQSNVELLALQNQIAEMHLQMEGLEKERDFYFAKVCFHWSRSQRLVTDIILLAS